MTTSTANWPVRSVVEPARRGLATGARAGPFDPTASALHSDFERSRQLPPRRKRPPTNWDETRWRVSGNDARLMSFLW